MKKRKYSILIFAIISLLISNYTYAEEKVSSEEVVNKLATNLTDKEKAWLKEVLSKFDGRYGEGKIQVGGDNYSAIGTSNKSINGRKGQGVLGSHNIYGSESYATIGRNNYNLGGMSYVVGYQASTYGQNSVAIGSYATVLPMLLYDGLQPTHQYGVSSEGNAIGTHAWATGLSNAYGHSAKAVGTGSVAIGTYSKAGSEDLDKIGDGLNFKGLQENYPKIFGEYIENENERANKVGAIIFEKYKPVFKDMEIKSFEDFKEKFGSHWQSYLANLGTQWALDTWNLGSFSVALGTDTHASIYGAIAIGYGSKSKRSIWKNYISPYSGVELNSTNTLGALSVGNDTIKRQIINVADATEDTDAVNLRQLRGAVKFLSFNNTSSKRTNFSEDESNFYGDRAIGEFSTALGMWAKSEGGYSISLGTSANSKKFYSIAIGSYSEANADRGTAIGGASNVIANGGVALGVDSLANRNAMTSDSSIYGEYKDFDGILEAHGLKEKYNIANNISNLHMDEYEKLNQAYQDAKADSPEEAEAIQKIKEFYKRNPKFKEALKEKYTIEMSWRSTAGALSVGNFNRRETRQIINVAAGTFDTDAVNVAQLKAIKNYVDNSDPFEYRKQDGTKVYKDANRYYILENGKRKDVDKKEVIISAKDNLQIGNVKSSVVESKVETTPSVTPTPKPNEENKPEKYDKARNKNDHVVVVQDLSSLEKNINSNITRLDEKKADKSEVKALEGKIKNNTESIVAINKDISKMKEDIKNSDKKSSLALSGVSNAIAIANLPQVMGDNKFNISASYGYYGSSHSLALGISGQNNKGNFIYKLSGSVNNHGNIAFGLGVGVMFGKITKDNVSISELKEINKKQAIEIENIKRENREINEKYLKLEQKLEKLLKMK